MKRTLIAALFALASVPAFAAGGVLATMPNEAGGNIEITNIKCPDGYSGFITRSFFTNGQAEDIFGCWIPSADTAHIRIVWYPRDQHKTSRTYNTKDFVATKYGDDRSHWDELDK
ncbi:hypothetical protein [Cupriavidus sp. BIS7]|uniref:hypothetical protein n=1 Tax=Cupriavidus sp. BIS7 TaxID=1217718 RepID=UPI0002FE6EB0|nr:hypothetical protein [Cupriavidus sp. BIS7]